MYAKTYNFSDKYVSQLSAKTARKNFCGNYCFQASYLRCLTLTDCPLTSRFHKIFVPHTQVYSQIKLTTRTTICVFFFTCWILRSHTATKTWRNVKFLHLPMVNKWKSALFQNLDLSGFAIMPHILKKFDLYLQNLFQSDEWTCWGPCFWKAFAIRYKSRRYSTTQAWKHTFNAVQSVLAKTCLFSMLFRRCDVSLQQVTFKSLPSVLCKQMSGQPVV